MVDCILLTAGTFHHLIENKERKDLMLNIKQILRLETGLCAIYLLPDSMLRVESPTSTNDNNQTTTTKFTLISAQNHQQTDDEWLCEQMFAFDGPKDQLSWRLRTCSSITLIHLLVEYDFEPICCCLNGKDLISCDELNLSSTTRSTPVIIVFRNKKKKILD